MAGFLRRVTLTLIVLVGAMGLCAALSGTARAEDPATDTVPYPDVWCRMPPETEQSLGLPDNAAAVYFDPQDHPVILYLYQLPGERTAQRYYNFFTGQVIDEYVSENTHPPYGSLEFKAEYARYQDLLKRHNLREIGDIFFSRLGKGWPLPDGGQLLQSRKEPMFPIDYGLQKVDAAGREVFDAMVILSTRDKQKVQNPWPENEYWQGEDYSFIHNRSILPLVYDLLDGTYLLTGPHWPGLLRVRLGDSLESPCLKPVIDRVTGELKSELILVDASWARKLYQEAVDWADKYREEHPAPHELPVNMVDGYVTRALHDLLKAAGK